MESEPRHTMSAEEVLTDLLNTARQDWNGNGVILWAQNKLKEIQEVGDQPTPEDRRRWAAQKLQLLMERQHDSL